MSFGFRLFIADKTVFVSAESLVGKEEGIRQSMLLK